MCAANTVVCGVAAQRLYTLINMHTRPIHRDPQKGFTLA